uniref:HDC06496 n=1 Tax=Drosophila melanogaster TaxID=7227 RepID=Q6IGE8_DROME|nr:TPA_inf: HDC06496 [Drosophila melanogaster]
MIKFFAVVVLLAISPLSSDSTLIDIVSSCINFQFKALLYLAESTDDKFHCIETCVYDIIRNLTKIDLPKRPDPEICQGLNDKYEQIPTIKLKLCETKAPTLSSQKRR